MLFLLRVTGNPRSWAQRPDDQAPTSVLPSKFSRIRTSVSTVNTQVAAGAFGCLLTGRPRGHCPGMGWQVVQEQTPLLEVEGQQGCGPPARPCPALRRNARGRRGEGQGHRRSGTGGREDRSLSQPPGAADNQTRRPWPTSHNPSGGSPAVSSG